MFFSVITKNLNFEILTKHLVIQLLLRDGIGLRMKKYGDSLKYPNFKGRGGRVTKNQYIGGIAKKRGLGQFIDLRGGLDGKEGGLFEEKVDTPMHTSNEQSVERATSKN